MRAALALALERDPQHSEQSDGIPGSVPHFFCHATLSSVAATIVLPIEPSLPAASASATFLRAKDAPFGERACSEEVPTLLAAIVRHRVRARQGWYPIE